MVEETIGIAGSGVIACGLAVAAAGHAPVTVWARTDGSAARADERVRALCERLGETRDVEITSEPTRLAEATFVIEAVVEDPTAKAGIWAELNGRLRDDAVLATTTSSLPVRELAAASGHPDRFVAFHVFNPVTKMELVELAFPPQATDLTRERARALAAALGKTAVEVPDTRGFVVNRLLFPYLFEAVRLLERTGIEPEALDTCMRLGAGHPLGPLALLDLVGLDVAIAIGEAIGADVPERVRALAADGALGRKAGRGFYEY